MYIDSHAHISSSAFTDEEMDLAIMQAEEAKIQTIINICTDIASLNRGLELSKKYPIIKNAGSTTPHDVQNEGALAFEVFEKHAMAKDLIAVGETGLDYFYEHSPKEIQKEYLIKYIELAKKANLPLIIHCRDAFDDFFTIIDQYYLGHPFLLHCFTGTYKEAIGVIDRGGKISFSGIVTFKKSSDLKEIAKAIDLKHLMIETDSPYLAPQEVRGKKNEPKYVSYVAKCLAELKGFKVEDVAFATKKNALDFFRMA
jgi:TatD DNase family protein